MIHIDRGPAPAALAGIREDELRRVRGARRKNRTHRRNVEIEIGNRYNHPTVRAALHEAQNHTCCYCEIPIRRKGTPIEHFRPKERAIRGPGRPEHGYWWLAWDWENLLLACPACNQTKGTKFPLSHDPPLEVRPSSRWTRASGTLESAA